MVRGVSEHCNINGPLYLQVVSYLFSGVTF